MIARMGSVMYRVVVYFVCAEACLRCDVDDAVSELAGISSELYLIPGLRGARLRPYSFHHHHKHTHTTLTYPICSHSSIGTTAAGPRWMG